MIFQYLFPLSYISFSLFPLFSFISPSLLILLVILPLSYTFYLFSFSLRFLILLFLYGYHLTILFPSSLFLLVPLSVFTRCCYTTVDSATTALQNGACIYRCISKQIHYKTSLSHNGFMKILEIYENYITLSCLKKKSFLQNPTWHITQSN